jgi:hypothetical protein
MLIATMGSGLLVASSMIGLNLQRIVSGLPDLVCRADSELVTAHATMQVRRAAVTDVYRFKSGKLFLSWSDREEYFYGDLVESEASRFRSGYKTILFLGADHQTAIVVHTDERETRVLKMRCVAT